MPYFQLLSCHIKIQICVGYFPDGRMRTRTFGIKDVRSDVSADDVATVGRAIAGLLAHPVVGVRLVRKYLLVTPVQHRGTSGRCRAVGAVREGGRLPFPIYFYFFVLKFLVHITTNNRRHFKRLPDLKIADRI